MKDKQITCYAVMGYKFPNRPAYYNFLQENKGIFLGDMDRFGPYVEPHFFKIPEEAQAWIEKFLEDQPDAEQFELKVVECQIDQKTHERHFKARNYFLKIKMMPHKVFETRPNLKPAYLREELVLGRGNTIAKTGNQMWFETEKEARKHMEEVLGRPAFQGYEFKIEKGSPAS